MASTSSPVRPAASLTPGRCSTKWILEVLEHVADPLGFLTKASAHLAPGGRLFVQVPNWDSLLFRLDGAKSSAVVPGRWRYFTPETLRDVLARAGSRPSGSRP